MRTSQKTPETIATIGIDLGKNTFHLVGLDKRGAIVLRLKVSRGQLGCRVSNMPRCLIGMEACSGSHHFGRQLAALGQDVRLIPAQYVRPFLKGARERLSRCRGDRGGRAATNYALCRRALNSRARPWIRSSTSGAIRGRPRRFPSLLARARSARSGPKGSRPEKSGQKSRLKSACQLNKARRGRGR